MKRFFTILLSCISLALVAILPVANVCARESDDGVFQILCISSYSLSYTTVSDQLNGLKDGLAGLSCDIDYEFMDARTYYSPDDIDAFAEHIAYKLAHNEPYDLLIICDDNAMRLWLNNRESLFADIPMIFLGVNDISDAETAAKLPNVTGVAEVSDYMGTFDLMHELFPDRTNVVAVVDGSSTGRGEYTLYREVAGTYDALTFEWILTDDYSTEGLTDAVSRISKDSMILYLDFMEDADGNTYTEQAASELLYDNAKNIPIFRTTSANLGYGVLGGKIYSFYDAGKTAGEMAARVLSGEAAISEIPLVKDAVTTYMFDQNLMDEYGITEAMLPMDSVIINPHQNLITFYRENTVLSNLIIIIVILLVGIIVILLVVNRRNEQVINTDFLTQMPNRLSIQARIAAASEKGVPFGILMMDVDHFKTINDTLGHGVGDELLVEVGSRLKELSSASVTFARIGGDEFMALVTGDVLDAPEDFCEEILHRITEVYVLSSGTLHITASMGLATYPAGCDDPTRLNVCADSALYYIKEHGRDGYMLYSPALEAS